MILIQLINKYFALLGISEQQIHHSHRLNARILMPFFAYVACISSCLAYILLEINNPVEVVEGLFEASSAFSGAVALLIIVFKLNQLHKLFNDLENIVQDREWMKIGHVYPSNRMRQFSCRKRRKFTVNIASFHCLGILETLVSILSSTKNLCIQGSRIRNQNESMIKPIDI